MRTKYREYVTRAYDLLIDAYALSEILILITNNIKVFYKISKLRHQTGLNDPVTALEIKFLIFALCFTHFFQNETEDHKYFYIQCLIQDLYHIQQYCSQIEVCSIGSANK